MTTRRPRSRSSDPRRGGAWQRLASLVRRRPGVLFAAALLCGGAARVAHRGGAHDVVVLALILIAVTGALALLWVRIARVVRGSSGRANRRR
ncbi:hypothetical protein IW252_000340 [Zhihengliuella flava]|uniref:Uncharacterized protein n=1 Tax=Zhihengliuella flava TaxID=1285193 RepID=A0A931DB00_9MICC|nr:hypothetical protein [Zhihengliuella flava]